MADENGGIESAEREGADTESGEDTVVAGEEYDVEIRSITGTPINLTTYVDDEPEPLRAQGLKPSDEVKEDKTLTVMVIVSPKISEVNPLKKGGVKLSFLRGNGQPVGPLKPMFEEIALGQDTATFEVPINGTGKGGIILVAVAATKLVARPYTVEPVEEDRIIAKSVKVT